MLPRKDLCSLQVASSFRRPPRRRWERRPRSRLSTRGAVSRSRISIPRSTSSAGPPALLRRSEDVALPPAAFSRSLGAGLSPSPLARLDLRARQGRTAAVSADRTRLRVRQASPLLLSRSTRRNAPVISRSVFGSPVPPSLRAVFVRHLPLDEEDEAKEQDQATESYPPARIHGSSLQQSRRRYHTHAEEDRDRRQCPGRAEADRRTCYGQREGSRSWSWARFPSTLLPGQPVHGIANIRVGGRAEAPVAAKRELPTTMSLPSSSPPGGAAQPSPPRLAAGCRFGRPPAECSPGDYAKARDGALIVGGSLRSAPRGGRPVRPPRSLSRASSVTPGG